MLNFEESDFYFSLPGLSVFFSPSED